MDRSAPEPLTVERCLLCCAILTFATDSPFVPLLHTGDFGAKDARPFAKRLRGTVFRTVEEYGKKLSELVEAAGVYTQVGLADNTNAGRTLMPSNPKWGWWAYYPWPPTEAISRALSAYWMASLSILPPSRLLNFWRAIEAVTPKDDREKLLSDLHLARIAPVWSEAARTVFPNITRWRLNASRNLRRIAIHRRDELTAKHGSVKSALKFIYDTGRGKAAHADRESLEYDMAAFIGDQLRDAELLRYMARVAIERAWKVTAVQQDL